MIRALVVAVGMAGGLLAEMPPHPRLLMSEASEEAAKERVAGDPLLGELQAASMERAEAILKKRTCRYEIPDGKRLLRESRLALENVLHCAWAWRMSGEERFRERAIRELDAACGLQDWNPSHFLDTAEMSAAVAIGYDWLFESLSKEQRRRYETALVDMGLLPAKKVYDSKGWWSRPRNNWSQVCAAGISLGAAAVAERKPELSRELLEKGRALLEGCHHFYEPDGAYPEGPSYWHYGSNYQVLGYAMWEELGRPIEVPGVMRKSGDFMLHLVGPLRLPFNFADAPARIDRPSPAQGWLARHFRDPGQTRALRKVVTDDLPAMRKAGDRFFPLHVLWMPAAVETSAPVPLGAKFGGEQPLVAMRGSWAPDSAYLAIKGGTATASHGHMDVGSFVYDAGGVRWFHDLGSDNYNMPGYFGGQRWSYFRLNSRSHNTLTIAGKIQKAAPEVAEVAADLAKGRAVVTMDPAYAGQAEGVSRAVEFDRATGAVRMIDRIEAPTGEVRWAAFTRAKVTIDGRELWLEEKGKRLRVTRHDDAGGEWQLGDARPPTAEENANEGFRMISFTVPKAETVQIEVGWEPVPGS